MQYMIPLFLVYFAEYFINQGLVSAVSFLAFGFQVPIQCL